MSEVRSDRFQAPISYVDIRASYNTFRGAGAALVAVLAVAGWARGLLPGPWIALGAAVVTIDAVWRLRRGTSALPVLALDATVVGLGMLARGESLVVAGPAFLYVLTAAMLLLPLQRAGGIIAYALAWAAPVWTWAPLGSPPPSDGQAALGVAAFIVFSGLIGDLLYTAGRALYAAGERQRLALESERRATKLKDEFVSMVSHELRTPLTSIAGFTDTLREAWPALSDEDIDEFLNIMKREATHLADLVEDILVIPRLEAGRLKLELEHLELRRHAFDTAQLVFQDGDKEFAVSIPGDVHIVADPIRLKQVFRNLLENARKYGGDQVLVEGERRGNDYLVVVSDNGPGVPEEDEERIFEHFEQGSKGDSRSDQGVGLGLPIARKLVRAMGGDLWYEARFPTGARFCFTLPLARHTPRSPQPRDMAPAGLG